MDNNGRNTREVEGTKVLCVCVVEKQSDTFTFLAVEGVDHSSSARRLLQSYDSDEVRTMKICVFKRGSQSYFGSWKPRSFGRAASVARDQSEMATSSIYTTPNFGNAGPLVCCLTTGQ